MQLCQAQALAADEAAAAEKLALVKGTRLQLHSSVWSVFLEIYARLRVFARTDAALKRDITDVEHGPLKKKRGPAAAPTTP